MDAVSGDGSEETGYYELEVQELEYDGEVYILRQYNSGADYPARELDLDLQSSEVTGSGEALLYEESYSYLLKLGLYPSRLGIEAEKPAYWNYVLVHDDAYTFNDLLNSSASGFIGDQIPISIVAAVPADNGAGAGESAPAQ